MIDQTESNISFSLLIIFTYIFFFFSFRSLSFFYVTQDTAFTVDERVKYGLIGILPSAIRKVDEQIEAAIKAIRSFKEPISKYMYLRNLQDWNEKLFFSLLTTYTEELMPIVYTPVVGEACEKFRYEKKRKKKKKKK